MVLIIQRLIQEIYLDKWDALDELNDKFVALEEKMGFPPQKRYRSLVGGLTMDTLVIERTWQSMAKLEKATTKAFLDPDYSKLTAELPKIIKTQRMELYVPHPPFPK